MSNIIHLFPKKSALPRDINEPLESAGDARQLTLPFDAPHILYILTTSPSTESEDFSCFVIQKRVAVFFDLRFSPRLDFVAPTRQKAFAHLKEIGLTYLDVFGRAGTSSPPEALEDRMNILKDVVSIVERTLPRGEPCLMMFDHQTLAQEYRTAVDQYFDVRSIDNKDLADAAAELLRLRM